MEMIHSIAWASREFFYSVIYSDLSNLTGNIMYEFTRLQVEDESMFGIAIFQQATFLDVSQCWKDLWLLSLEDAFVEIGYAASPVITRCLWRNAPRDCVRLDDAADLRWGCHAVAGPDHIKDFRFGCCTLDGLDVAGDLGF